MSNPAFDTLATSRQLQDRGHFTPEQADAITEAVKNGVVSSVATKADLAEVRTEIAEVQSNLGKEIAEVRVEIAEVRTEIAEVQSNLGKEIAEVRVEIAEVQSNLGKEIAEVRTEIAKASNRTVYTLGGLIGLLFIIDRLLPLL